MDSQPSNIEPYVQPGNPVTRNPLEEEAAGHAHAHRRGEQHASPGTTAGAHRSRPQEGIPSSLGRGVRGGGGGMPVDDREARSTGLAAAAGEQVASGADVDAEQVAPPGEGEVAGAVARRSGTQRAPGAGPALEQDFASDLDRKKAEQAAARREVKGARAEGIDVDGRLG